MQPHLFGVPAEETETGQGLKLWTLCSLHQASVIFEKPRDTLRKLIAKASVTPVDDVGPHPRYRIRDIAALVFAGASSVRKAPEDMTPAERKSYYDAEKGRLDLEQRLGRLCLAADVDREMRILTRAYANFLDTFCDTLERDAGLTIDQFNVVSRLLGEARQGLYLACTTKESPNAHD